MTDSTTPTLDDPGLQARLQQAAWRLASEFIGIYGPETVERYVCESAQRLVPGARIVDFLPLLTYRFAYGRWAKLRGRS
jgi:arsenate reductase (thioredoxin)